jgi:hypothetical protein
MTRSAASCTRAHANAQCSHPRQLRRRARFWTPPSKNCATPASPTWCGTASPYELSQRLDLGRVTPGTDARPRQWEWSRRDPMLGLLLQWAEPLRGPGPTVLLHRRPAARSAGDHGGRPGSRLPEASGRHSRHRHRQYHAHKQRCTRHCCHTTVGLLSSYRCRPWCWCRRR